MDIPLFNYGKPDGYLREILRVSFSVKYDFFWTAKTLETPRVNSFLGFNGFGVAHPRIRIARKEERLFFNTEHVLRHCSVIK